MKNSSLILLGLAVIIINCIGLTPAFLGGLPTVIGLICVFIGTVRAISAYNKENSNY